MTINEDIFTEETSMKVYRDRIDEFEHSSSLVVSLHSIEFSGKIEDHFEVASNVFFSNLLYLLYIKNVVAGKDFETAKEKARLILLNQLEKKKQSVLGKITLQREDSVDSLERNRKLVLLERAMDILEKKEYAPIFHNVRPEGI